MRTKTQRNFHKEMKKYEKKRKKLKVSEPVSYIYKNENYYEPPKVTIGFTSVFRFMIRVAIIVGILSYTGIIDLFIDENNQELNQVNLSPAINKEQKMIYDYLNQYDIYTNRAKEIINRYNQGNLELIEVHALQKVLIDSMTFTDSVDELLFNINEKVIQYHEELINWLEVLRTSNSDKINLTVSSLKEKQEDVSFELINLFNQFDIPYQILDNQIIYQQRELLRG